MWGIVAIIMILFLTSSLESVYKSKSWYGPSLYPPHDYARGSIAADQGNNIWWFNLRIYSYWYYLNERVQPPPKPRAITSERVEVEEFESKHEDLETEQWKQNKKSKQIRYHIRGEPPEELDRSPREKEPIIDCPLELTSTELSQSVPRITEWIIIWWNWAKCLELSSEVSPHQQNWRHQGNSEMRQFHETSPLGQKQRQSKRVFQV